MQPLSSRASGVLFALGAFGSWGFFPLYFRLFPDGTALELLIHRMIWSVPFLLLVVGVAGRLRQVFGTLRHWKNLRVMLLSATFLAGNWVLFIWAVQAGRVLEVSLGYYINPLLNVALGVLVLGERLSRLQVLAIALASSAVVVLGWGSGVFPWVALTLASSFALYGLLRKTMPLGAAEGLLAETLLMLPFGLAALAWMMATGRAYFLAGDAGLDLMLASSGLVTALPLIFFAAATRRLPLSAIGMFQYIAPTLQFLLAVFLFGEHFTQVHALAFGLIWTAVALFLLESWRRRRRAPRAAEGLTAPVQS